MLSLRVLAPFQLGALSIHCAENKNEIEMPLLWKRETVNSYFA